MFRDRLDAGVRLARALRRCRDAQDTVVLAVPRGGLAVGGALARKLDLPLGAILTKKIGHPENPEVAIGAVSLMGEAVDSELIAREAIPSDYVLSEIKRIRESLRGRWRIYLGVSLPPPVAGKTVILTDDGAATGQTLLAAIALLRRQGARRIVAALPVAPPDTVELLKSRADKVVCLDVPEDFMAIGEFYADFAPVSDEEAAGILREAASPRRQAR